MIINKTNLAAATTGFRTTFREAFAGSKPMWDRVATQVPSSTRQMDYKWMRKLVTLREWVGDRVVQNLSTYGYTIVNKPYEATVGVDRDDIADDQLGIYTPLMAEMGHAAAVFPDRQVFSLLKNGFTELCFDGQPFFHTDHPVGLPGREVSVSNTGGGSGTPWFLLDTSRPIKPLIYQTRQAFEFVAKDNPDDDNVFHKREFLYGVDGRMNCGYSLPQLAYASKQTLNAANYAAAREAMQSFMGDDGEPLGVMPNLLVVPPSLEAEGREVLLAERTSAGATNIWRNTAELLVMPWLAA